MSREPPSTVAEAWRLGREHLAAHQIDEAALTAEVLLRHALEWSRTDLYRRWQQPVPPDAWGRFRALLDDRVRGRPVAYITGHREFMGLDFQVDERVLIPRPETEVLVEAVLALITDLAVPVVADIGTGSGAIAVTVAHRRVDALVLATDISTDALEVARTNAARCSVAGRIRFLDGDLVDPLEAVGARVDVIACNPPYVAGDAARDLPREIRNFEPAGAVLAPQPAFYHARLADAAPRVLKPGGWLAMEVAAGGAARVVELLQQAARYEAVHSRTDGLGWERVVAGRLGPR